MDLDGGLVQDQEILAWWSAERGRIDRECREAAQRFGEEASARVDALSLLELLLPSAGQRHIERKLNSDINVFNRRMELRVKESAEVSIQRVEGECAGQLMRLGDLVLLSAAGGWPFLGSLFLKRVSRFLLIGMFLILGLVTLIFFPPLIAVAITLAAISQVFLSRYVARILRNRASRRFKLRLVEIAQRSLVDSGLKSSRPDTRAVLLNVLDEIRSDRLEGR